MSLDNPLPSADIENREFENSANSHRCLMIGKTTTSTYLPILVGTDGSLA